jgi:hypothetical protein
MSSPRKATYSLANQYPDASALLNGGIDVTLHSINDYDNNQLNSQNLELLLLNQKPIIPRRRPSGVSRVDEAPSSKSFVRRMSVSLVLCGALCCRHE